MMKALIAMLAVGGLVAPTLGQAQAPQTFEGPVPGAKGDTIGTITIRGGANGLLVVEAGVAEGLAPTDLETQSDRSDCVSRVRWFS